MPSPQLAEQSLSVPLVQPVGQQPSSVLPEHAVTLVYEHWAWQVAPDTPSIVQALVSAQLATVGQLPAPDAMPVSHFSPASTTALPHDALQSPSLVALQPVGQHPSLARTQAVIGTLAHACWQALLMTESAVQALVSAQLATVGHESAPVAMPVSQVSPGSLTPLPHEAEQSESLVPLQPGAQQPSPPTQVVMGVFEHCCRQSLPLSVSVVQALLSAHDATVGQLPAPVAMPVSHSSPDSLRALPHTDEQSASVTLVQPAAQQPSPGVQDVMSVCEQTALHCATAPVYVSTVQALLSSHAASVVHGTDGAAPSGLPSSQVSVPSRTPLPQVGEQSTSVVASHPPAQQPSLVIEQTVIGS